MLFIPNQTFISNKIDMWLTLIFHITTILTSHPHLFTQKQHAHSLKSLISHNETPLLYLRVYIFPLKS